jgi:hypothetical protein
MHARSRFCTQGSTCKHQNEGKTNNEGWMLYLVYVALGVYCTWCMLYLAYAVLGVCCTQYMLYSVSTHDDDMEKERGMT